ncbi:hypothetical protein FA15DRAFT_756501 [Coprinopsis marcescibilis]|uniref:Uncharacterized protein n=1 Tax=Coprinopsis marcescibilis TaxID=230819 RepID=A0A5C3KW28_COPMA|nr:hypothetical protein FA15DRAFT_756501 [Coprinopsis marcescibilis]
MDRVPLEGPGFTDALYGQQQPASSPDDRPRIRLAGFHHEAHRAENSGTPKLPTSLLKPFRFNQKPDENSPLRAGRYSFQLGQTSALGFAAKRARSVHAGAGDWKPGSHSSLSDGRNDCSVDTGQTPRDERPTPLPPMDRAFGSFSRQNTMRTIESSVFDDVRSLGKKCSEIETHYSNLLVENEKLKAAREQALREVEGLKSTLKHTTSQLTLSEEKNERLHSELDNLKAEVSASATKLMGANASEVALKGRISELVSELDQTRVEHGGWMEKLEQANHAVTNLRERIDEQGSSLTELKSAYSNLKASYSESCGEVKALRKQAKDAVEAATAISSSNVWVSNAREGKELLAELRNDLDSSRRVSDILRDKLHHFSSLLLEAQDRVKELETEKTDTLSKLISYMQESKEQCDRVSQFEAKHQKTMDRLLSLEQESYDLLAKATSSEEMLRLANQETERSHAIIAEHESELTALRAAKEEHLSRIMSMQDTVNSRDKDLAALRVEVKALHESKADLRALWSEAKKSIVEKDHEISHLLASNTEYAKRTEGLQASIARLESSLSQGNAQLARTELERNQRALDLTAAKAQLQETQKVSEHWKATSEQLVQEFRAEKSMLVKRHEENVEGLKAELDLMTREFKDEKATLLERSSQEVQRCKESAEQAAKSSRDEKAGLVARYSEEVERWRKQCEQVAKDSKEEKAALLAQHSPELRRLGDNLQQKVKEFKEKKASLVKNHAREIEKLETQIHDKEVSLNREQQLVKDHSNKLSRLTASLSVAENEVSLLRQEREKQSDIFATLQKKAERESELQERLQKAQEARAAAAETACQSAKQNLEEERRKVCEWQEKAEALLARVKETEKALQAKEVELEKLIPGSDADSLREMISTLTRENEVLREYSTDLKTRYQRGELSEGEREVISYVIRLTEASHEQQIIQKNNEIRSRDNLLAATQDRVSKLQKRVAELLEEQRQGQGTRSIVNIKSLAVSSPPEQPPPGPRLDMRSREERPPATPPRVLQGPGIPETIPSFSRLAEVSDAEDDTPLSELSSIRGFSSDAGHKRLRAASPPPAASEHRGAKKRTKATTSSSQKAAESPVNSKKPSHSTAVSKARPKKRR